MIFLRHQLFALLLGLALLKVRVLPGRHGVEVLQQVVIRIVVHQLQAGYFLRLLRLYVRVFDSIFEHDRSLILAP